MPSTTRSRVSYVIPPPHDYVPLLQLLPYAVPRHGAIVPLLLSSPQPASLEHPKRIRRSHPRHRLGVVSLALDTSTQLSGKSSPEGILYTGGRDGLVCSWDLGIPMKKKEHKHYTPQSSQNRWETMTGWGDDGTDEEGEDKLIMDGDVLGDVSNPLRRRHRMHRAIPYEHAWETDLDLYRAGKPTQFRQCSQTHTDWVNDLLLCNYNQTVVSASSDGSIKAWNPNSAHPSDPFVVGTHGDYVRCLASCREHKWIVSGSFDRTIKLWDTNRTNIDALLTLNPPSPSAPKSSIYALAADPYGHAIASGSPERVVRMWDPRSGRRTAKLVGHTDNIRAILISDDARYLLTGSADASIKLWSLASQRCLHTFTYHADSVWSLYSTHPSLEIFYSGDKTNLVCKVDVERCADVSEGECVVLCQEPGERSVSDGINKIVALNDNLLWTASGSSSIRRWKVPPRRVIRAERLNIDDTPIQMATPKKRATLQIVDRRVSASPTYRPETNSTLDKVEENFLFGIPFESLVKLTSPNDPFTQPYASTSSKSRGRDPEVATLYSAASIMSVPPTTPIQSPFHHGITPSPIRSTMDDKMGHSGNTARAEYEERELASDAVPLYSVPDDEVYGDHGLVRSILLNDRLHALTVDISGEVAVWDIVRGVCLGRYPREEVAAASTAAGESEGSGEREGRSPRESLEAVRERIEGEAVVAHWSSVDTKTGVLTVHLTERCFEAEIYADEAGFGPDRRFNDELRINIGKWVLRNLFIGFIREEQRMRRSRHHASTSYEIQNTQKIPVSSSPSSPSASPVSQPTHLETTNGSPLSRHRLSVDLTASQATSFPKTQGSSTVISSANMIPAVAPSPVTPTTRSSPILSPLHPLPISKDNPPTLGGNDAMPMLRHARSLTASDSTHSSPSFNTTGAGDYHAMRTRVVIGTPDESKQDGVVPQAPGGGLMGRLKQFGKVGGKKVPGDVDPTSPVSKPIVIPEPRLDDVISTPTSPQAERPKTLQQVLLSGALSPPTSSEAPTISLPPNMMLLVSEEDYPGWRTIYRGSVSSTWSDLQILEDAMPMWLLEYLMTNKVPAVPIVKISFVLLPWPDDPDPLPEFLNTSQSKLTASRFLRVRKLTNHVQERLEKMGEGFSSPIYQGSPRSSLETNPKKPSSIKSGFGPKAEDLYQILCNDVVLPLDMTLAAVRQFIWRQSTELIMYYRRKAVLPPPSGGEDYVARAL